MAHGSRLGVKKVSGWTLIHSMGKPLTEHPLFRYLAPFMVFMLMTEGQRWGDEKTIFWIYAAKTIVTGAVLWFCFHKNRREIDGYFDGMAILLGLVVLALWILPVKLLGGEQEVTFDPTVFSSTAEQILAISFRILGAALIVPIMEELIWRSFLMRYLIQKDFLSVPIGTYAHLSFWGTVGAFMLVHRMWEWPMAFLTGVLYGFYIVRKKNLVGCILAHATTNLGLAIYILITKEWHFW